MYITVEPMSITYRPLLFVVRPDSFQANNERSSSFLIALQIAIGSFFFRAISEPMLRNWEFGRESWNRRRKLLVIVPKCGIRCR